MQHSGNVAMDRSRGPKLVIKYRKLRVRHHPSILLFFFLAVVVHRYNVTPTNCVASCLSRFASVRVSDRQDFRKQTPEIMLALATTVAYNLCLVLDFGSYGAKQEISNSLYLVFESRLCSSEELQ